jgi:hypothetical protein
MVPAAKRRRRTDRNDRKIGNAACPSSSAVLHWRESSWVQREKEGIES